MTTVGSGGGLWSMVRIRPTSARAAVVVAGWLIAGVGPAPCAAQPPAGGLPSVSGNPTGSGAQIPPGTTLPGGSPSAGMGASTPGGAAGTGGIGAGAAGAQPSLGGLPALPGAGGLPSTVGSGPMSWASTGAVQPPPVPAPRREEPPQPVGPLPLPALYRLPSITLDHYGDGSGTVGAGLIWMGQLPDQYGITRYHDGAGKVGGPIPWLAWITPHASTVNAKSTLSYGPPGLHPGFYGFGLSFHPGYGYGGNALGVGALGGYPCYGGPGYPLHYGYPKFAYPYYEGIGQLYYDQPVVITDLPEPGDFGPYTGASAYAYTHPSYAAEAAATGSIVPGVISYPDTNATNPSPEATITPGESIPPAGAMNAPSGPGRFLGMAMSPATAADGQKGLKIDNLIPGSTAENAGLQIGDIIVSVNGRAVEQRPQLNAIINSSAPGGILNLGVLKAGVGPVQSVTIRVP